MSSSSIPAARSQYLLDLLAQVPDPRKKRGRRHPLAGLLAVGIAAVIAGWRSFAAIGQWAADAGTEVLAGLGAARGPAEESTFRRAFALVSPGVLDQFLGAWLHTRAARASGRLVIAVDGKAVRGAAGEDGLIPYLLAAAAHGTGTVLAEHLIGPKTNEVPGFAPLPRELDGYYPLAGHVITADAGHTVKAHARFICEELLAHYAFTVKLNTPALWDELNALDWAKVPVQQATEEQGHGRRERRTIQVTDAPAHVAKRFPHARQVALIERYVTRTVRVRKGKRWVRKQEKSAVAVFIITSLEAREASPAHVAGYVRGHWTIENKVHWVRSPGAGLVVASCGSDATRVSFSC
jgi:predicted transposase YbfD/YdcC